MIANACKRGAYVVSTFVDYGQDVSLVEFGDPVQITDPEDMHLVGAHTADLGNTAREKASEKHPEIDRLQRRVLYKKAA